MVMKKELIKDNICMYTLENESIRLGVLNIGASIRYLEVKDKDGVFRNVILGYNDIEKYKDIQVVGPVRFLRYEGALGKQSVRIEVWPVPSETGGIRYTAELSRACKNLMEAAEIRIKLIEKLDRMGILIHGDNLKTKMILKP